MKKTKKIAKKYLTGFLLFLIGGLMVNVYQEGKRMWQEVTEVNQYVDSYFQTKQYAAIREDLPVIVHEDRKGVVNTVASFVDGSDERGSGNPSLEQKIIEAFGTEEAVRIAQCESRLSPETVGDGHLSYEVNGKKYGESYGLFQIRALPGRTDNPEKFKQAMFNPEENIKYAKKVYEERGNWGAWHNCAVKENLI